MCQVCFWEDDKFQLNSLEDPDTGEGGPNTVSLLQSRVNFQEFGAMDRQFVRLVRAPLPDEKPD
ncbi:CPCC family cysteine-rich protein [Hymenobacter metallicola]|uniref:CPCC family cysteine-rich protein n=1 Tax=Hymenobacter metallicola TaxID=2563114 RepID=UPI00198194B2